MIGTTKLRADFSLFIVNETQAQIIIFFCFIIIITIMIVFSEYMFKIIHEAIKKKWCF